MRFESFEYKKRVRSAARSEPVTITIKPPVITPFAKRFDILKIKYGRKIYFNLVINDAYEKINAESMDVTMDLYALNVSKWWIIRKIQLWSLKKVFRK